MLLDGTLSAVKLCDTPQSQCFHQSGLDPVSGRDQYSLVQQRCQTELDQKLEVLHWTVLVCIGPFSANEIELPSTTTNSVIEGK